MKRLLPILSNLKDAIANDISARRRSPRYALAFLTYRCTSQCKNCDIWRRNDRNAQNELGWDEWRGILDQLKDAGIRGIEIFGGDALLRKDLLYKFIEYCAAKRISTALPTNSNLLDAETAASLVEAGLDEIYFSLDGVREDHDIIRGSDGSYDRVLQAIGLIRSARNGKATPRTSVCTTVSRTNFANLPRFANDLGALGIERWELNYICEFRSASMLDSVVEGVAANPFFVSTDGESYLLRQNEVQRFREVLNELGRLRNKLPCEVCLDYVTPLSSHELTGGSYPGTYCLRCRNEPTISPYGDVLPCHFFENYVLGNLRSNSLAECWGSRRHVAFLGAQRNRKIELCAHCHERMWKCGVVATVRNMIAKRKTVRGKARKSSDHEPVGLKEPCDSASAGTAAAATGSR